MKIVIPETSGKELFDFLIANKSEIIAQKKALPKFTDPISYSPVYFDIKDGLAQKTDIGSIPADATTLRAKLVANTAYWFDSQQDVCLPDCWKKTIKEGKGKLHLKNHDYKIDSEVGDVIKIYSQDMSLTELGLNKPGTTQSLIYESEVRKDYDAITFGKYKQGRINQHSIGLQYVRLEMAFNDADYKEPFALWNEYIDKVINREAAEKQGYMFLVYEIKLIEVSAVLLGANELTPTLEVRSDTFGQPPVGTIQDSLNDFDLSKAIKETIFFN